MYAVSGLIEPAVYWCIKALDKLFKTFKSYKMEISQEMYYSFMFLTNI